MKRVQRIVSIVLSFVMTFICICQVPASAVEAYANERGADVTENSVNTWSWSQNTGKLAVDYEGYISQHDLVYSAMPLDGEMEGMPVANGSTGAQVWQDDGIRMQIHSVDNAPNSAFGAAKVVLSTTPALDDLQGFEQRLNLYDGYVDVKQNDGFSAEIFGVPNSEILGIHVSDSRENVQSVSFDIEMWIASDSAIKASGTADKDAWKTVNYFENNDVVGFTKGVSEKEPFGYAFAVTVDGADFEVTKIDELTARISITMPKNGEYTIWMNSSSRCYLEMDNIAGAYEVASYTSTAQDIFDKATSEINEVKTLGYEDAIAESKNFWHDFWQRSFVHYDNGNSEESDYIENFYYLSLYQIGGGAYAKYQQMHFMNGVYSASKDEDIDWNDGYWHFNQRPVYHPLLATNHVDGYLSYLNFYNQIMDSMTTFTVWSFNENVNKEHGFITDGVIDALFTPETVRWDGYSGSLALNGATGSEHYNNAYVGLIFSSGMEIAENMYNAYRYSMDEDMLAEYYEYIRRTVQFIVQWAEKDENGVYQIDYSNALENWWKINNAVQSNAAIRSLIPKFLDAASILDREGVDADLIAQAKDVLANLEALPTVTENGETRFAPYDLTDDYSATWPDGVVKKNKQQPELELVYPHDLIGVDSDPELLNMALNNYNNRSKNTTAVYSWNVDGIQQARLGLGNDADEHLGIMINMKQKRSSGYTDDGNGEMESMGLHISTMTEMLLQSYDGVIRVFPAVPDNFEGAFTLLAKGGFLVSSEYSDGAAAYIGITSQYGGEAIVSIPWENADFVIVNGQRLSVTDGRVVIDTEVNGVYLIQPVSEIDTDYELVAFTAEANSAPKSAFEKTLGISESSKRIGVTNVFIDFEDSDSDGVFDDVLEINDANIIGNVERLATENGYAASFDGNGGYLEIPHSKNFDPMENFALSFDMKSSGTGTVCLFDKNGDSGSLYIDIYGINLRVIVNDRVTSVPIGDSGYPLRDGKWHTVKIVVNTDKSLLSVFCDGQLQKTDSIVGTVVLSNTQAGRIGLNRNGKYSYTGLIDNFMITDMARLNDLDYDFNDSVSDGFFDDMAGGYDAIIRGSIGSEVNGEGYAALFDGNGGYLEVDGSSFFGALENFTLSFDMKSSDTGTMCLVDKYGDEKSFFIDIYSDNMRIFVNDKITTIPVGASGYNLRDGQWHNVKIEVNTDKSTLTVYFDGQKQKTDTIIGGLVISTDQAMRIGLNRNNKHAYVGLIDNFKIASLTKGSPYEIEYDFDSKENGEYTDNIGGYVTSTTGSVSMEATDNGYAANFTGSGNYLDVVGSNAFGVMENFIVSFDMKSSETGTMCFIDKYGSEKSFYVDIYRTNLRVIINGNVASFSLNSFNLRDGAWHNVRIVVDTDNALITVYFDNQMQGTAPITAGAPVSTSQLLRIGSDRNGSNAYIGLMDNLTISSMPKAVQSITINKSTTTITAGENERLAAEISPVGAERELIWESSDENIVTVNRAGRITAISKGQAIITVKTADGSLVASCNVTVTCSHSLSDYISDREGNHYRKCTIDGCDYETDKTACVGSGSTCTEANHCLICNSTIGSALGHDWQEATTEAPKTCKTCGATEGDKLPTPEEPEVPGADEGKDEQSEKELNFFERIWLAIVNFFKKLFGIK